MKFVLLSLLILMGCNVAKQPPAGMTIGGVGGSTTVPEKISVSFSTSNYTVTENTMPQLVNVTIALSSAAQSTLTVSYSLSGNAVGVGTDYTDGAGGSVIFNPGDTTAIIPLTIADDTIYESSENIVLTITSLSDHTNYQMGNRTQSRVDIYDNESIPILQFTAASQAAVAETAGTVTVNYNLTDSLAAPLSSSSIITATVYYAGTAESGVDFTGVSTLTIPALTTSGSITLTLIDDAYNEGLETVQVQFALPQGATIGTTNAHSFQITDNEAPAPPEVQFALASDTAAENTGTYNLTISVTGTLASAQTVKYYINNATSSATSGADYVLGSGVTVSFPANVANPSVVVPITLVDNAIYEANETLNLSLVSTGLLAVSGNATFALTITDNDVAPVISFDAATSQANESDTAHLIVLELDTVSGADVTVTIDEDDITAVDGTDYVLPVSTVTIPAGTTSVNVPVLLITDGSDEATETFSVDITAPTNATLGAQDDHVVSILDIDAAPNIAFTTSTSTQVELDDSDPTLHSTALTVTVALSQISGQIVTVPITVAGTSTVDANSSGCVDSTHDDDHTLIAQTVTVPAGTQSVNVTYSVCNDNWYDPDETIIVTMGTPTNANLGAVFTHTVTITDQDTAPTVQFASAGQIIDEDDVAVYNITAQLTGATQTPVVIPTTIAGTATLTTDYTLSGTTITIPAGSTTASLTTSMVDDTVFENDETVILTMSTALTGASISGQNTHTVTINETTAAPTIAVPADYGVAESTGLQSVPLTLTGATCSSPLVLTFGAIGGTATFGSDHDLAIPQITFPALTATANFGFNIIDDSVKETLNGPETIIITATGATCNGFALAFTDNAVTITITDDEPLPTISYQLLNISYAEGAGLVPINLVSNIMSDEAITITSEIDQTVVIGAPTYLFAEWDDTEVQKDFNTYPVAATYSQSVVLAAGALTTSYNLNLIDDAAFEYDEKVLLTIDPGVDAQTPAGATLTLTITENDTAPYAHLSDASTATIDSSDSFLEADTGVDTGKTIYAVLTDSPTGGNLVTSTRVPVTVGMVLSGTTSADQDYDTLPALSIVIAPGASSNSFAANFTGDDIYEANEQFILTIGALTNALVGSAVLTYTIGNDDTAPTASLYANYGRGFRENQGSVQFQIRRQHTGKDTTIEYAISGTSTESLDHTLSSGEITIAASTTEIDNGNEDDNIETVNFSITDDALGEGEESIVITLTSADYTFVTSVHNFYIFPSDRVQMALGRNFSCALYNGVVKCWGQNEYLGLGLDNSTANDYYGDAAGETVANQTPVDLGSNFTPVKIAAGEHHICALSSTGYVKCWGENLYGKTGNGVGTGYTGDATNEMGDYLTAIPIGEQVADISVSAFHSCALTVTGQAKCWGINSDSSSEFGQLGYDTTTATFDGCSDPALDECMGDYPGEIAAMGFISFASIDTDLTAIKIGAAEYSTCFYLNDASTGYSRIHCIGDAANSGFYPSAAIPSSDQIKDLVTSPWGNNCVVKTTGVTDTLECWTNDVAVTSNPVTTLTQLSSLAIGNSNMCTADQVASPTSFRCGAFPAANTAYVTGTALNEIYLGYAQACASVGDSQLTCWGEGSLGQLASGAAADNNTIIAPGTALSAQSF
jgi:uncharacterized protein YegL